MPLVYVFAPDVPCVRPRKGSSMRSVNGAVILGPGVCCWINKEAIAFGRRMIDRRH